MRRVLALRLAVAAMVCYLSFLFFIQTPFFIDVESRIDVLLPGIELKTVAVATLTVLVLIAGLSRGERSARFVYSLSLFFFLPTVLSLSLIDWPAVLGFSAPTGLQPLFPTLLVGLAIIGGYVVLLSTSWLERTRTELTRRGGARPEVDSAISGQLTTSIAVVSASVLVGMAVVLLSVSRLETALAGFPSAYAVLGLGGGLLVIVCVSSYLAAVRGPRPREAPEPEELEFEILGPPKRGKKGLEFEVPEKPEASGPGVQ